MNLSPHIRTLLGNAGLSTAEEIRAVGRGGLLAIDGIGPKTADEIIAALPAPLDPKAMIRAVNTSNGLVLVGERFMFPGEVRTIRREQLSGGLKEL